MTEIWIPETIISVFLLLFLLCPFFKRLRALDGLVWLPFLSLLITLGLFPAYGFRPECLPLLLFELLLNILNIPLLMASAASHARGDYDEQSPAVPLVKIALFIAASLTMFIFSPKIPLELVSEGVQTRVIRDTAQKNEYFLRIYAPTNGEPDESRPLIFLAPPEAGSLFAVDRICAGLRDRGFTVIGYSRRGLDSPAAGEGKKYFASPARLHSLWRVFRTGAELKKINDRGKDLEAARRVDIEFLLPLVLRNRDTDGQAIVSGGTAAGWEKAPVFLAGYGAAGSALLYLSESPGFAARYNQVKGIVSVESRLWSAYREENPMAPAVSENAKWFARLWAGVKNRLQGLKRQKVTGLDRLPRPPLPVLYLVSDRAVTGTAAGLVTRNPYRAILETMRNSSGPAALAALEGSGPLDYSDFPLTHPVYPLLFPGAAKRARNASPVDDTVALIGNFARMLLTRETPARLPEPRALSAAALVERRGLPDF